MKITKAWLVKHNACQEGIEWFENCGEVSFEKVGLLAIKQEKGSYSRWLISKKLKNKKRLSVALAIFAAEQVIKIFEDKYPDDKRPRKAIRAAKKWLKNPTIKNKTADAAADAADAATAAANAAAAAAATTAADAATAAANAAAAYAAAAAADAADAATAAANAAAAYAAAARKEMQVKIYRKFIRLIGEK